MTIYVYKTTTNPLGLKNIGYIVDESLSHPDRYLDMLNWHKHKHAACPEQLHLYVDRVDGGRGICFEVPSTSPTTWYLALSIGWLKGSKQTIFDYIAKHKDTPLWLPAEEGVL